MNNQTLRRNTSLVIHFVIFVLFWKMNIMVERPKVIFIKAIHFFFHSFISLIFSMFNLFGQLTSNKMCFWYLENQNECIMSFAKLNMNILALYIRDKGNDIDCNCLTSETSIQLSQWREDCSNAILSPNSSFTYITEMILCVVIAQRGCSP